MSENRKENLFARLSKQAAKPEAEELPVTEPAAEDATPSPPLPPPPRPKATPGRRPAAQTFGKKANPEYCQANSYIPKTVKRSVDRALLDMEGMDFSTLVEELLTKWLKNRRVSD